MTRLVEHAQLNNTRMEGTRRGTLPDRGMTERPWGRRQDRWGKEGKIESSRGVQQNDGVKEERLKVTEWEGERHYIGKIQPSQRMPPEKPFDKGPRTIYTKTNEITDPWVTCMSMYALPLG